MILTQRIGDTVTHRIAMRWTGRPFNPAGYFLIFTVKANADTELDAAAKIQKTTVLGITTSGSYALVSIVPQDTAGSEDPVIAALPPANYTFDIQAQKISTPADIRTVASGSFTLLRDVTRGSETEVPVYIADPGFSYDSQIITYS